MMSPSTVDMEQGVSSYQFVLPGDSVTSLCVRVQEKAFCSVVDQEESTGSLLGDLALRPCTLFKKEDDEPSSSSPAPPPRILEMQRKEHLRTLEHTSGNTGSHSVHQLWACTQVRVSKMRWERFDSSIVF